MSDAQREAFEKFMHDEHYWRDAEDFKQTPGGHYEDDDVERCWQVFKAACAWQREEDQRVLRERGTKLGEECGVLPLTSKRACALAQAATTYREAAALLRKGKP